MKIPKTISNKYIASDHIKFNLDLDYIPICSILYTNANTNYIDNSLDVYKNILSGYNDLTNIKNNNINYVNKLNSITLLKSNIRSYFKNLYFKLFNDIYYTVYCNYVNEALLNRKLSLSYLLNEIPSIKKESLISSSALLRLYKSFYDKKEKFCFYLIGDYMLFDLKYTILNELVNSNDNITNVINEINNKTENRSIIFNSFDLQYILTIDKDYVKYGVMFEDVDPKYLKLFIKKSYVDNPNLKGKIDKIVIPYYKEQNVEIVYEDSLDYFFNKPIQHPKKIGEDLSNQVLKRFVSCLKLQQ